MSKEATEEKEEKALATKKSGEVVSRGEEFEHWLERVMGDMWRPPFPSLFGRDRWLPIRPLSIRMPSLDVYEEKDSVVVKAELPGMKKEDVEVNLAGETLTIKGEKKEDKEVKEDDYYRRERSYGSFLRTIALPCDVKSDEIKASFKDGVLEVRMPKTEEAKKKSIPVKID
jgi:HSP20 family protein